MMLWIASITAVVAIYLYGVGVAGRVLFKYKARRWTVREGLPWWDTDTCKCSKHGRVFRSPDDPAWACFECRIDNQGARWIWPVLALGTLLTPFIRTGKLLIAAGERRPNAAEKQAIETIIRESQRA